jgi:hypothetical protein
MSDVKSLYDEDFYLWSKSQAEALRTAARSGTNQAIDWENVAEEIESLGRSDKRELSSQIRRIIEHLLKIQYSRATDPRLGWINSIDDARIEIEVLLDDSPSLKSEINTAIPIEMRRGARKAIKELAKYSELDATTIAGINATTYTSEQILGDWFPPEPEREPATRGE